MAYINIQVWNACGEKRENLEVPNDVPVNRVTVRLIERLSLPRWDGSGRQLLSYKLHHRRSGQQLFDDQTLHGGGVEEGDVLRLNPELTAGAARPRV